MSEPDRRWPRWLYGAGEEPDPRATLANERTFLAWIRTGLGFLAAGVAVATVARLGATLRLEVRLAAVLLAVCGLVCAVDGYRRWLLTERALRLASPYPSGSAVLLLAAALVLVAVGALVVLGDDVSEGALDPARAYARTRLTWQRTTLTAAALLLVVLRLLVSVSNGLALAAGLSVAILLVVPIWSAAGWQLAIRAGRTTHPLDGRAPALLALLVGLGAVACLLYALT